MMLARLITRAGGRAGGKFQGFRGLGLMVPGVWRARRERELLARSISWARVGDIDRSWVQAPLH